MELVELLVLFLAIACGYAGGAVRTLVLHRRTLGLEYRIQDLENRNLTTVNREKSAKRWAKEKESTSDEEDFLASLPRANAARKERYANDPLEPYGT